MPDTTDAFCINIQIFGLNWVYDIFIFTLSFKDRAELLVELKLTIHKVVRNTVIRYIFFAFGKCKVS